MAVGCGGGSGSSGPGTTAVGTGTTGGGGREAIHEPIQSRGIKGEDPSTEAATSARLSAGDCAALGQLAERRLDTGTKPARSKPSPPRGTNLSRHSDPSPPLSRCELSAPGVSINVYLDTGFAAHQRYSNRITETVQFGVGDQAKVPHPVPHVGERAAYNADANWIPALRSLLAVRGNRWLTVTISVAGLSNRQLRDEAAVLAHAGFKLTAVG